jgi:hypothetical protein
LPTVETGSCVYWLCSAVEQGSGGR